MIIVKDIVNETYTNDSGYNLFITIKSYIDSNDTNVILSFEGATITSSSFLNSSIGNLVENYGISILKRIKPTKLSQTQADVLRKYFNSLQ